MCVVSNSQASASVTSNESSNPTSGIVVQMKAGLQNTLIGMHSQI